MIPNLNKTDLFWEGTLELVEWEKYYGNKLDLRLNIGGDCVVDEITDIHEKGYVFLREQQSGILSILLDEIYSKYSIWQEEYDYDEEERRTLMPNLTSIEELKKLIKPRKIFIMDVAKEGIPYIGVEFWCSWDEDHGVGIMLYKNKVVEIGGADTAFLTWIAEEDAEK